MVKLLSVVVPLLVVATLYSSVIQAQPVQVIQSQVRLSICGDLVIEGPEDCEGADLGGQSCSTIGFLEGDLSCDSSCAFDTSLCVPLPSPTPSPTPSPSSSPSPTPQPGSSGSSGSSSQSSSSSSSQPSVAELVSEIVTVLTELAPTVSLAAPVEPGLLVPPKVRALLVDGNTLEYEELIVVLEKFAQFWRQSLISPQNVSNDSCDLNDDGRCDIIDLSVLLYYVDTTE